MFQSAHLAMIDTLMMAYTVETVSVERVVSCIQHYPSFDPDGDVPYDTEDAVMCWINKVWMAWLSLTSAISIETLSI